MVHKKSIKYLNGFRWSGSSLEKDSCGSQIGRHFVKVHFRQSSQEIGFLYVRNSFKVILEFRSLIGQFVAYHMIG